MLKKHLLLSLLIAIPVSADAAGPTTLRVGQAFDLETGEFRYQEIHLLPDPGSAANLEIEYRDADGVLFGSKAVSFELGESSSAAERLSPWLPTFTTTLPEQGFEEGLRVEGDDLVVRYRERASDALDEEALPDADQRRPLVADAGFDRFIRDHWDLLLAGEKQELQFLVPSLGRFMRFRVRHLGQVDERGVSAEAFVMEPGNWFLRAMVDPIAVRYGGDDRGLLRYTGISNLPELDGGNMEVDIVFDAVGVTTPAFTTIARASAVVERGAD
jgi:hypothetical protein